MSDSADVLGVAPDATLQEIKRAYARLLKTNRPDDDPVAFARVHAAYEACVARIRRRGSSAGGTHAQAWFDDEDLDEDELFTEPAQEPLDPDEDEAVQAAVDQVIEAAKTMPAQALANNLRSDVQLYDLAFKRHVADLVVERASYHADDIPWRALSVIYEFFAVDSIADPRLRQDYLAREVWLRVQADARFARRVQEMDAPYRNFADRTVLAELFDPPNRWRRLQMHLLPMLPGKLRDTFQELSAEDPERAEAALSGSARDYWLPLTDPSRWSWRRAALALGHCAALSFPFALLIAAPLFGWLRTLGIWGLIAGVLLGGWLIRTAASFGLARYNAWRLRAVGSGETPVGATILADRVTALVGGSALLSILVAVIALRLNLTNGLLIVQVWLVMFMAMPILRAPRFRWEAAIASVTTAALIYPLFRELSPSDDFDLLINAAPGAFACGILAALVVDAVHAHLTHQALVDVRDGISFPQCALAVAATLVDWLL